MPNLGTDLKGVQTTSSYTLMINNGIVTKLLRAANDHIEEGRLQMVAVDERVNIVKRVMMYMDPTFGQMLLGSNNFYLDSSKLH